MSQVILESCRKEHFVPKIAYSTTQWDLLMTLARELGVAILPSPLTDMYNEDSCVKAISSKYIPWKFGIVVKKGRYKTRALEAFFKIVAVIYSGDH